MAISLADDLAQRLCRVLVAMALSEVEVQTDREQRAQGLQGRSALTPLR